MDTLRKETLTAAGIDVDNALERFMGKDDFLERMLKKFAADVNYQRLVEAVERQDAEAALQASHTMKGMCGNLSIMELSDLFTCQVELFREEKPADAFAMMPEISRLYEKVKEAIGAPEA